MAINGDINTRHLVRRVAIDAALGTTVVLEPENGDGFRTALLALVIRVTDATVVTLDSHIADPVETDQLGGEIDVELELNWQTPWGLCCTTEGAALRLTTTGGTGSIAGFAIVALER